VCLRNWYIAPTGGGLGTQASPWPSISAADTSGKLAAGDCVNLASGTYPITANNYLAHGGNANSVSGYVVYRSSIPRGAKLKATGSMYNMFNVNADYVIFDGLELDGGTGGQVASPTTGGSCLEFDGHHAQALNNLVHDCGGGGITAVYKDWYWFIGNTVHDCAKFNGYQTSAISIYEPAKVTFTATAADTAAIYHIQVNNNNTYANAETYLPGTNHTDGNGIILDDFLNTQGNNPNVPAGTVYPYKSLVSANTSHDNGGRAIHIFSSTGITVTANTTYNNVLDQSLLGQERGGLSVVNSTNITVTNNKSSAPTSASGLLQYGSAAMDMRSTGSVWTGNATLDPRSGTRSLKTDNTILASSFPTNNPLGGPLP